MNHLAIDLIPGKKVYFASDFHLGAPNPESSREREHKILRWFDQVEGDAQAVFLVGDVFDFWFEYHHVVPKGFTRLLGRLATLRDKGLPIYIFRGNHDMWMFDYFPKELDIPVLTDLLKLDINEKKLLIGHGDGLGPGDHVYKILRKVFRSRVAQFFFKWLHPSIGMALAHFWSSKSRLSSEKEGEHFEGENEWLLTYSKEIESTDHHDYYLFGHRHLPLDLSVSENARYINMGEWVNYFTYAVFDGTDLKLEKFED